MAEVSATLQIVVRELAAFAVAVTGAHVPLGEALPRSEATDVSRPLPLPTFWARLTWPLGTVQEVVVEDLSTQYDSTTELESGSVSPGDWCCTEFAESARLAEAEIGLAAVAPL